MRARPALEDGTPQFTLIRGGRDPLGVFNEHLFDLKDLLLRFSADHMEAWKGYSPFEIPHQVKGWTVDGEVDALQGYMSGQEWYHRQVDDFNGIVGVSARVLPAVYRARNDLTTCVLCCLGSAIWVVDDIGWVRNANSVFVHRSWLPRP